MKIVKKFVALVAVFAIILTAFAACAPKKGNATPINNPEDFYGHKIAVQSGTTSFELVTKWNEERGDKDAITIQPYQKVTECFSELKLGRVDAVFVDSVVAEFYTSGSDKASYKRVWLDSDVEPIAIALRKDRTKLGATIDAVLDSLYFDGKLKEIALKEIGSDMTDGIRQVTSAPTIPTDFASELKEAGVLHVGYELGYPPMEYTLDDAKTKVGFDVALADEIAKLLGLKVVFHDTDWNGIRPALEKGEFDCIISTFSINAERQAKYYLTKPYINQAQCIIVLADNKVTEAETTTAPSNSSSSDTNTSATTVPTNTSDSSAPSDSTASTAPSATPTGAQ
ncbi:MAG: transporter substrate-binding domain-containing protein [Oscillospiraceae bacterium]|jgi:ABC-type amino acid transport substrate-binding protein|nr:transporter substrate-binding domain-containing protein [Oscillospiraceae bacterium]